jgi:hypothetical protein
MDLFDVVSASRHDMLFEAHAFGRVRGIEIAGTQHHWPVFRMECKYVPRRMQLNVVNTPQRCRLRTLLAERAVHRLLVPPPPHTHFLAQCFVDGVIKPEVKDLRACPEVGGTVMFPADSNPYPFGVDPYWHGTKVRQLTYAGGGKTGQFYRGQIPAPMA